jgi:hypothetical protein
MRQFKITCWKYPKMCEIFKSRKMEEHVKTLDDFKQLHCRLERKTVDFSFWSATYLQISVNGATTTTRLFSNAETNSN